MTGGGAPSNLLSSYSLQSLGPARPAPAAQPVVSPAAQASDLASLMSRFESSGQTDAMSSGFDVVGGYDDQFFDAADMQKMVAALDADDDADEVAAAQSAASAWGPVPANYSAFQAAPPAKGPQQIPAPSSAAQSTPIKGVMTMQEQQAKMAGAAASPAPQQQSENLALAGLPAALHHLALSGQTGQPGQVAAPPGFSPPPQQQQQPPQPVHGVTYMGPALPHFQHGSPAPQGLSVDDHERQHFYIPLPRSSHNLGFMTKSEIALVFRIQLSQLQSIGDPLSDNFYYEVMQARKGGKVNSSGQAILPVFKSGVARNEDGSPKLPEGTLGRISAFSIHKPKRLMAIDGESSSTEADSAAASAEDAAQPRKSNLFSGRTLNFLIEEGYRCLMDLEDVDAVLASLAPHRFEDPVRAFDRQRLSAQRAELCTRLLEALDLDEVAARMREVSAGEHLVFKFYALPKGRLLLYRALVLLNPPHTYQLVDVLMHDLMQISSPAVAAPSTDEKLIALLSDILYAMPLMPYANEVFSYFLTDKHRPQLLNLIRSPLLCALLQVLLKKGHEAGMILAQNPQIPLGLPGMPGIRETVGQWRAIFDHLMAGVQGNIAKLFEGLPKDAKPTLPPTQGQIQAKNRRAAAEKKNEKGDKSAAATAEEKKEDSKPAPAAAAPASEDKKPDASGPSLATRFSMWELMAAFFSHANESQRAWLNPELKAVLQAEIQMLYGEYQEMKRKQAETAKLAAEEKEKKKEAAAAAAAASAKDGDKDASAAADKKDETSSSADPAASPSKPDNRRGGGSGQAHTVPPASSLPPPPSPALRFLSSALLGEQTPEFAALACTWNDLHNDYLYYQMKHQQKVAAEQARLQQQQQMRAQRQQQQKGMWQQYQQGQGQQQQQGGGGGRPPMSSQHAHFHQPPAGGFRGGAGGGQQQFVHQPLHPGHTHAAGHRGPHGSPSRPPQQSPPPQQPAGPPKPVPVWVKPGQSGASVAKTPVKPAAPNASS